MRTRRARWINDLPNIRGATRLLMAYARPCGTARRASPQNSTARRAGQPAPGHLRWARASAAGVTIQRTSAAFQGVAQPRQGRNSLSAAADHALPESTSRLAQSFALCSPQIATDVTMNILEATRAYEHG